MNDGDGTTHQRLQFADLVPVLTALPPGSVTVTG
jgi:hypothetical protein